MSADEFQRRVVFFHLLYFGSDEVRVGIRTLFPEMGIYQHAEVVGKIVRVFFADVYVIGQGRIVEFKVAVATVGDDDGREIASDAFRYPADAACGCYRVVSGNCLGGNRPVLPAFQYVVYQFAGNRYFCFRVFAEGYADGIAYSVGQQGTDTDALLMRPSSPSPASVTPRWSR